MVDVSAPLNLVMWLDVLDPKKDLGSCWRHAHFLLASASTLGTLRRVNTLTLIFRKDNATL